MSDSSRAENPKIFDGDFAPRDEKNAPFEISLICMFLHDIQKNLSPSISPATKFFKFSATKESKRTNVAKILSSREYTNEPDKRLPGQIFLSSRVKFWVKAYKREDDTNVHYELQAYLKCFEPYGDCRSFPTQPNASSQVDNPEVAIRWYCKKTSENQGFDEIKWNDAIEMLKMASKIQYNQFGERRTAADETEWWQNDLFHKIVFRDRPEVRRKTFGGGDDIFYLDRTKHR